MIQRQKFPNAEFLTETLPKEHALKGALLALAYAKNPPKEHVLKCAPLALAYAPRLCMLTISPLP